MWSDDLILLLQSSQDAVDGILEVLIIYLLFVASRSNKRCFVTHIGDVRTCKACGLFSQFFDIDVINHLQRLYMYAEDFFSTGKIWLIYPDLTVETTGAK